jgi:hypothetical protein
MTDPTTTTVSADPIIATTQHAPVEENFESVLTKQLKRPNVPKMDIKSLDALPDNLVTEAPDAVRTPAGFDEVKDVDIQSFLNNLDNKDSGPVEDEPVKETKKAEAKEETKATNDLDFSDIDLSKDPDPIPEEKPKGKKSKEDNIAELRKKAEAYEESLKAKDSEVAEYRAKLEKLEGELERTAFERSPKFKETYEKPYQDAISKAGEFAKEIGEDESIAEKALSLKGRERINFIDESFGGGAASAAFLQLINDADAKRGNLETALTDYRTTANQLAVAEQQQQTQTLETINKNFDRVKGHLAQKSEFFRLTGDEEHDKRVNERIEAARNIIHGNASPNEMTVVPFLAVLAREVVAENEKIKAELAKYKNRAAQDSKVQPRITKSIASDTDGETRGKPKSALEAIRSQLR